MMVRQNLKRFKVYCSFWQPHSNRGMSKTCLKIRYTPPNLRLFIQPAGKGKNGVIIGLRHGVTHPESITTRQAAKYLTETKGIPTAKSTLEIYRCRNKGPRYRKIGSRVFYPWAFLEEYANGVEVRIFDPSKN